MFLKRLTRSRSNSQSYADDQHNPRSDSKVGSIAYEDQGDYAHHSGGSSQPNSAAPLSGKANSGGMYSSQNHYNDHHGGRPLSHHGNTQSTNGYSQGGSGSGRGPSLGSADPSGAAARSLNEAAPDLLTRAFNEAVRPYTAKLDELEAEVADLRAEIEELHAQRREVHAWIDKRGLRPDVPPSIAALMDASTAHNPTHAAATLNAQLDRKITIVNFDLHRLQDDLNDSLPTPSFSACMLKFLPDIQRLSQLPAGPRHAFDLLLKLGGNLNSHGGLESGDEDDLAERRRFYALLDGAMVDVVRGRFKDEGEGWGVQREIKRIEKTGAYLRTWGVEPYFPRTLDVMRDGASGHGVSASSDDHMHSHGLPQHHAQQQSHSAHSAGGGTPPSYQ